MGMQGSWGFCATCGTTVLSGVSSLEYHMFLSVLPGGCCHMQLSMHGWWQPMSSCFWQQGLEIVANCVCVCVFHSGNILYHLHMHPSRLFRRRPCNFELSHCVLAEVTKH